MKLKKNNLLEISNRYFEKMEGLITHLHQGIEELLEDKINENILGEVINGEHELDRIKEEYIQELYETKRSLPFLVEDRFKIINDLDCVADIAEELARLIEIFPFKIYDELKDEIGKLNDIMKTISMILVKTVELMENNFDKAYEKTKEIEARRREARDFKFDMLGILYKKKDKSIKLYLISKIIVWMYDIISMAEELSDFLRGLIIKYPRK